MHVGYNLALLGMPSEYYDGLFCEIKNKDQLFDIGRIYKNVLLYGLGFIILGGIWELF